jgi:AhpD family alkylhydroperoxidase
MGSKKKKKKIKRDIISIDEKACTRCGDCIDACAEFALEMGKESVRLKGESFCDGQGACIAVCTDDALRIVKRECEPFEPEEVKRYVRSMGEDELVKRVMEHFLKVRRPD